MMKSLPRFLLFALALMTAGAHAAPVATTAGSNLTAYNPSSGATNNNTWNNVTNPRANMADAAPTADFGNCNALILRCASPKCSSGGCADLAVASAIVQGCVNSNASCKQYGDDLVNYISAQMVAQSAAKNNQAAAAAEQNNQQMQAMANQMAMLQQQMASQNDALVAALDAQKEATAQAIASATAASNSNAVSSPVSSDSSISINTDITEEQRAALESGVSEDLMLRAQISGEILTQLENAEKQLKELKITMTQVFDYAGCDSRGGTCAGPKRVAKFKELANKFFDPYQNVLDYLYEAILLSQTVGVDVSNIYMMLNNSCERWGKYMCSKPMNAVEDPNNKGHYLYVWPRYDAYNCKNGKSVPGGQYTSMSSTGISMGSVRGGMECYEGQTIPPEDDTSCTLMEILAGDDSDGLARSYLYTEEGDMGDMVRVGCASNILKGSWLFKGMKQKATIDIETLQRIVNQDSPRVGFARYSKNDLGRKEQLKWCALTESGYTNLQKHVSLRSMPQKKICINERTLNNNMGKVYIADDESILQRAKTECDNKNGVFSTVTYVCYCVPGSDGQCEQLASKNAKTKDEAHICESFNGANWPKDSAGNYIDGACDCDGISDPDDRFNCQMRFNLSPTSGVTGGGCPSTMSQDLPPNDCDGTSDSYACCTRRGGRWDGVNDKCKCNNVEIFVHDACWDTKTGHVNNNYSNLLGLTICYNVYK